MTTAHDLVDEGTIEDDAYIIYYHQDEGAWLLNYNVANPDEDDIYRAFGSEKRARSWCRENLGYVQWTNLHGSLWRGVVRGEVTTP